MRNPIIVQKYGGACLETPEKIRAVASSLADLHSRGHRVVAIVSAMGKTTDELVKMAYQVSPHPNRRELDMLLTTGERISMSLMSMALSDLGVPAISFEPHEPYQSVLLAVLPFNHGPESTPTRCFALIASQFSLPLVDNQ